MQYFFLSDNVRFGKDVFLCYKPYLRIHVDRCSPCLERICTNSSRCMGICYDVIWYRVDLFGAENYTMIDLHMFLHVISCLVMDDLNFVFEEVVIWQNVIIVFHHFVLLMRLCDVFWQNAGAVCVPPLCYSGDA